MYCAPQFMSSNSQPPLVEAASFAKVNSADDDNLHLLPDTCMWWHTHALPTEAEFSKLNIFSSLLYSVVWTCSRDHARILHDIMSAWQRSFTSVSNEMYFNKTIFSSEKQFSYYLHRLIDCFIFFSFVYSDVFHTKLDGNTRMLSELWNRKERINLQLSIWKRSKTLWVQSYWILTFWK